MSYPFTYGFSVAPESRPVVYVSSDILVDPRVQSGAGGLGVVSGSVAAELEHNYARHQTKAILIGTYASYGYQKQVVTNGVMGPTYVKDPHPEATRDTGIRFSLTLHGRECKVAVRTPVDVSQQFVQIYLLDTDVEENPHDFRMITRVLYGEGNATAFFDAAHQPWHDIEWMRVLQAAVLGLGAVRLLEVLQVVPHVIHINDSHPVFGAVYVLGQYMRTGLSFEQALAQVRTMVRFTTHTVLGSGNKQYPVDYIMQVCGHYPGFTEDVLHRVSRDGRSFRMTTASYELAGEGHVNGVSIDHARIATERFGYSTFPITNGVYRGYYQDPRFSALDDPADIPRLKREIKQECLQVLCDRAKDAGWQVNNVHMQDWLNAVLIGIARRGQEYKRLGLLWHHKEYDFVRMLLEWRWIAVAWGGLVHPDDHGMMQSWNKYWHRVRELPNVMPVFNYRMDLMRTLKAASQIWLNTPQYGYEACGTSWMSAMMNCALPVSIGDGGILEAEHVMFFGSRESGDWHAQYEYDAMTLWQTLYPIIPRWQRSDPTLLAFLYEGKLEAEERFSSTPMVDKYRTLLWK